LRKCTTNRLVCAAKIKDSNKQAQVEGELKQVCVHYRDAAMQKYFPARFVLATDPFAD